jgi:calcineurin-like phosphoesterase family protein
MNIEKKNLPESVYSRLKNIALAKNRPTQEVLRYYAMERFLYRLSVSQHKRSFFYTGRPFQSVSEMNERLIENWNALVKPQDMVFFLGDFGLGSTDFLADLCARLHGNKICIRGNHDGTPANPTLMHTKIKICCSKIYWKMLVFVGAMG